MVLRLSDEGCSPEEPPKRPRSDKHHFLDVLRIVDQVVSKYTKSGLFEEEQRPLLLNRFITFRPTLTDKEVSEKCRQILEPLFPEAKAPQLNDFDAYFETLVGERIRRFTEQIVSLKADEPLFPVLEADLFPLTNKKGRARQALSGQEILCKVADFVFKNRFFAEHTSVSLRLFLYLYLVKGYWVASLFNIKHTAEFGHKFNEAVAAIEGLAHKKFAEMNDFERGLATSLTRVLNEPTFFDKKSLFSRLTIIAEKCRDQNIKIFEVERHVIKKLKILSEDPKVTETEVTFSKLILGLIKTS